jgi:hypothetical protein
MAVTDAFHGGSIEGIIAVGGYFVDQLTRDIGERVDGVERAVVMAGDYRLLRKVVACRGFASDAAAHKLAA